MITDYHFWTSGAVTARKAAAFTFMKSSTSEPKAFTIFIFNFDYMFFGDKEKRGY